MTSARRKPRRNQGDGKLSDARAEAGVDNSAPSTSTPSGIHNLEPEEGELFETDPANIGPNPMNRRLGLRNMDEMVDSVKRQGVHTPGAAMHTKLFMEKYPEWADQVTHPERTYILGPGHRRHAAAVKAGRPMLLILRDKWAKERTVEENLISENNDRDDLSPIEQALQLDLLRQRNMTGEQIAERTGYGSRGTVSKFLNLLILPQEIQTAVHERRLSHGDAYTLSTIRDEKKQNHSDAANELQLRAFGWMQAEGITAEAAKNRLVLPAAVFPTGNTEGAVPGTGSTDEGGAGDVSGGKHAADSVDVSAEPNETGEDDRPTSPIPHQSTGEGSNEQALEAVTPKQDESEDQTERDRLAASQAAAERRSLACRLLLAQEKYASAPDLSALLIGAVLTPLQWKGAATLAHSWLRELGKGPVVKQPDAYFTSIFEDGDAALKRRAAFAIALAANELHTTQHDPDWDHRARAHLTFLITSKAAAYEPTEYEQLLLGPVSSEAQ